MFPNNFKLKKLSEKEKQEIRENNIVKTLLIYKKEKNGKNKVVCSTCGKNFFSLSIEHNTEGQCPKCKRQGIFKNNRYGRKTELQEIYVLRFVKKRKKLYGIFEEADIDFKNFGKCNVEEKTPIKFFEFGENPKIYKNSPNYYNKENVWHQTASPNTNPSGYCGYYTPKRFGLVAITVDFENIKGYEYINLNELPKFLSFNEFLSFLVLSPKNKALEVLVKNGYKQIVKNKLNGISARSINFKKTKPNEIFKLPKPACKKIKEWGLTVPEVASFQKIYNLLGNINFDQNEFEVYKKILSYLPTFENIKKLHEYIFKNEIKVMDYRDYVGSIEYLNIEKEKNVLYPKNFKKAHDEAYKAETKSREETRIKALAAERKRQLLLDKKNEKLLVSNQKKILKSLDPFVKKNLIIVPAQKAADIRDEGKCLGHCVSTYIPRIYNKETAILFVRKKENPEKPYFTLEISPKGDFRQCRGKHNCNMNGEVQSVVNEYIKNLNKHKREKHI